MIPMRSEWNVIAEPREGCFEQAKWHMYYLGTTAEAGHGNLLIASVPDIDEMLEFLVDRSDCDMAMFQCFECIRPMHWEFDFETSEEFLDRASEMIGRLAPKLAGKRFCIRLNTRGRPLPEDEGFVENALYNSLLDRLQDSRDPGQIGRGSCDVLIDVETVGNSAGIAMWTRSELERYPFLGFRGWEEPIISSDARSRSSARPRM
jgi:hypothetical protein